MKEPEPQPNPATTPEQAVVRLHSEGVHRREKLIGDSEQALRVLSSRLATSSEEAAIRYRRFRHEDPFPRIKSGLLHCSAFCAYIAEAGIFDPFSFAAKSIQIASLDLPLLGKAVWYDEKGEEHDEEITSGKKFRLRANAIAFVTLGPYLRLPEYIALRFNLRVRHVYRGLLLGTGPLVDPGYQGYLAIPLHNLTNRDVLFHGDEMLVSVEFTKLETQPHLTSDAGLPTPPAFVIPFPEPESPFPAETEHPIWANFRKAKVDRVESSLPALDGRIRRMEAGITIAGAIVLLSLVGVIWQATAETRSVSDYHRQTVESIVRSDRTMAEVQQQATQDSLRVISSRLEQAARAICAEAGADSQRSSSEIATFCR